MSRFVYGDKPTTPELVIQGSTVYRVLSDHLGSVRVTGLVRFGARDYEPVVGRWVSKDPIQWQGGQTNLYVYGGGDPVNTVDPLGLYGFFGGWTGNVTLLWLNFSTTDLGFSPFRHTDCSDGPSGDVQGEGLGVTLPAQLGAEGTGMLGFFTGTGEELANAGGFTLSGGKMGVVGGVRVIWGKDTWGAGLVGGLGGSTLPFALTGDLSSGTTFTPDAACKCR